MSTLFSKCSRALALVTLAALATGCATSRSIVDIDVPALSQASAGEKVAIVALDERTFERKPRSADIPSLKSGEIDDTRFTERAIARKRNGYGKALGDVLLPSGKRVDELVRIAVANAYTEAGYHVVSADEANSDVRNVKVHIKQFWSWFSPGFFQVAVNNKAHLILEPAGAKALDINTEVKDGMQVVTDSDWKHITDRGLQAITAEVKSKLD